MLYLDININSKQNIIVDIDNVDNVVLAYSLQHAEESATLNAVSFQPSALGQGWEGLFAVADKILYFNKVAISNNSILYLFKLFENSELVDYEALLVTVTVDCYELFDFFDYDVVSAVIQVTDLKRRVSRLFNVFV